MLICTLDRNKMESLNTVIKEKNNLSPLNRFEEKGVSEEDLSILNRMGMVDSEGKILETIKPTINILSNPHAVVKMVFTGGAGTYEHNINYDKSFKQCVSFTVSPNDFSIDDEMDPHNIVQIVQDFVGRSNLKSLSVSKVFSKTEALVIASILDIERRASLRAFIDEIPMNRNSYNANMIWRIINSTSTSIQWFVSIINGIIGENTTLTLQQVQSALEVLKSKGIVEQNGGQYQLTGELIMLPDRMIVVDNVLSVQISRVDDNNEITSAGFTCIQSGVHDLLFLDYDGNDIIFETISSVRLLDYLEQLLNCESYISKLEQ